MEDRPLLLTAFEPSGDALAARLITALRARGFNAPIHALAGPQCEAAGARLIETTTEHPVMLLKAAAEVQVHRRRLKRLKRWLADHDIAALVPTDSPAANWSVCSLVRQARPKAKIVHLVAPQLWAWGPWRIKKLRRLTDHLLCLLPFEPDWFGERGVEGTFVGHPLFDAAAHDQAHDTDGLPDGSPRLAVLPGSRRSEITSNAPAMAAALHLLQAQHPDMTPVAALRRDEDAAVLQKAAPHHGMQVVAGRTDDVLAWADVVLVVSGTATLQVVAHRKPMVTLYRVGRIGWNVLGRHLVRTRTFTLPNLLGEHLGLGRMVPELVPFFGDVEQLCQALGPLLNDGQARQRQAQAYNAIHGCFAECRFEDRATAKLLELL
jgi:lipid-A-disaccharide synthase